MKKKLDQFYTLNEINLSHVSGGSMGNMLGHAIYFVGRGLRENGKALNKALTKH
ncbi:MULTISPECIES: ComC/BlpC family leader-containing pheromone/bacteriocin [Lactiplantibacillus]|jgi:hypothetical protein|uniref:ComC/BlpC family peptide pheromone/bacteriocin n=1 Tax=Lactiplantibacillus argentoratensis TaxID=271881 RepID=A0AAN1UHA3_9LACO|nr:MULTISPECIES: ComC/BlpC family leader-containing pheromone/bacteriocin [Lactiplantibacillus]GEK63505.1 hypothetical protein LJA01_14080 [Lactobacillus japonicus]AYJ34592.1 ComC/BlpC family peptide pheromone/bacteriocin [Lactiplantibacillus argentoratensis]KRM00735.1 hypothetical protein FD10_GL000509 [Lactiplantibacillus argentoratensis DSM 16365]KTF02802.1 hypothetical protein SF2A35B_0592 [Lactiplantibacillus plantarum]KZT79660.1 hypothetical protein Nizo1839_1983 [Lactiplantibacillus pla